MQRRKVISLMLGLVMLFSMTANAMAAGLAGYSDMPNNWSTTAIENAINNELLTGANGKIMPNDKLTRAQMAAIVNRAFGTTAKGSLAAFSDVLNSGWYYEDMAKAVNMGTFKGSNGKLNPDKAITREEVFVVLASAFKLSGADSSVLGKFSDASTVSTWAKPATAALVAAGYAKGSAGKLNPQGNITRAEFAQIMDNLIKSYFRVAGTYSSVPEGNIMINTPNVTLKGVTVKGDLIIGDGVGNGEVTLDSVKVTGRTVVRGGGVNSIKIIGASDAGTVIVARVDGKVRVAVSGNAKVQVIVVDDGSNDVIVEGKIGTIDVKASGVTVTANNAQIGTVNVGGAGSKIVVGAGSTVDKVIVKTAAIGTTVTGTGKVTKVEANANNVKVDTPNTSVSVGAGITGVTAGGKGIEAGNTGTTTTINSSSGGGSSTVPVPTVSVGAQNGTIYAAADGQSATYSVTTLLIADGQAVTITACTAAGTTIGAGPTALGPGLMVSGSNVVSNASTITVGASHASAGTYYFKVTINGVTSGLVTLVVTPPVKVTGITVTSAGEVTELANDGTLQMSTAVTPATAMNKTVTWSVTNGTGTATIDSAGLLTATGVGTVTVKAAAQDGSGVVGEKVITVTTAAGNFTLNGSTIVDYNPAGGLAVVIPSKIGGVVVTSISMDAFKSKQLTSVTIPDGVTSIGINAFWGNQLTGVIIPSSVTSIGAGAFEANQLTDVTIPNSVTSIGIAAFNGVNENKITLGTGLNSYLVYADPEKKTLIGHIGIPNPSLSIPNSVTSISNDAFMTKQLTSVSIPTSVISIGDYAFAGNQLTSLTIPNSVASIGRFAFAGNLLTSITIGSGVTMGDDLLARGNNNFRDAYLAGGAGTYTGTQDGVWTKLPDPSVSVSAQNGTIFEAVDGQSATYTVTTVRISDGQAATITGCTADGTPIGAGPTSVGPGLVVAGSNVVSNASTITVTANGAVAGNYYFKVTIDGITSDLVTLVVLKPALSTPTNLSLTGSVVSWDPVPNCNNHYTVRIYSASDNSSRLAYNATTNSFNWDQFLANFPELNIPYGKYYIKVMAIGDASYSDSLLSGQSAFIFKRDTPVLYSYGISKVSAGKTLETSSFDASFNNTAGQNVPGVLAWDAPTTILEHDATFTWTFTPTDPDTYKVATGFMDVTVISAAVGDVTVAGPKGSAIGSTDVVITITNIAIKADINADTDLSNWITNLPAGLTAKAKATVAAGATVVTITIAGTPTAASGAAMAITIPAASLESNWDSTVTTNANAKFAIGSVDTTLVPTGVIVSIPSLVNSPTSRAVTVNATTWVGAATTVSALKGSIRATDSSAQAYTVTTSSGVAKVDSDVLVTGDQLIVTAEVGAPAVTYAITVQ